MNAIVLAEKPSVAKELARVLGCKHKQKHHYEGGGYLVTWALGHLVELAEPEDYDVKYKSWELADLPLMPERMKRKVMKETAHQFRGIAELCKRSDVKELIIATDAGREGELVARWVMEQVKWKKPFRRLWISSQTDQAIKDGFRQLRPGSAYDGLFASAVCRAEADWLIGLNLTRALTCKYNAQLAAGRVQTPTLGLLIDREREISAFQPVPYWQVYADFGGFQALWRETEKADGRLFDRERAAALVQQLRGKTAKVAALRTSERAEPHPLAYDLTALQRDANIRLGFSAKQTSSVLQRLYEQHKLVTYPRTDSAYLTSDMVPTLKGRLERIAVGPYQQAARKALRQPLKVTARVVDDAKVSDHHAIIPTEQHVQLGALTGEEKKLYDLIVKRFIALFYPPCRYDVTRVTVQIGQANFYAAGQVPKDAGWKEVYSLRPEDWASAGAGDEEEQAGEQETGQLLPPLRLGESLAVQAVKMAERSTQPPGRYSEAGLLGVMEKKGLGTPATRADIIEKLLGTDTIERLRNKLVPTAKGRQLIELVTEELRSADLTAAWERELEQIARGKGDPARFMAGIRKQTASWVEEVRRETKTYKPHNLTHSRCPECSKPLMEIKGKRGKTLVCSDRDCGYRRAAEPALSNKRCPQCRKKMEIHTGKAGKYAQCRPCNVVEKLDEQRAGGAKALRKQQAALVDKYSDNVALSSSLGDALKAALAQQEKK